MKQSEAENLNAWDQYQHSKIGNNVEIAGGSGVIKDIPDNAKVMGYPAKNIRQFLRDNK